MGWNVSAFGQELRRQPVAVNVSHPLRDPRTSGKPQARGGYSGNASNQKSGVPGNRLARRALRLPGPAEGSGHVETGKLSAKRPVESATEARVRSRTAPSPTTRPFPASYRPAEAPGL